MVRCVKAIFLMTRIITLAERESRPDVGSSKIEKGMDIIRGLVNPGVQITLIAKFT